MTTEHDINTFLLKDKIIIDDVIYLKLPQCQIQIKSNSQPLLDKLRLYFKQCQVLATDVKEISELTITALETASPDLEKEFGLQYVDWQREANKSGRKDEYINIGRARIVRKVRTGVVFLQHQQYKIASGPCLANDNQVINFIDSQYMTWLQNQQWLICHASGLIYQQDKTVSSTTSKKTGIAFAGLSGGGKSTLMLFLLKQSGMAFVTNDRLFIRPKSTSDSQQTEMVGIPKLPRINPGTIVGDTKLHALLSADKLDYYQQMPHEELWPIEEKYDVPIGEIYGEQHIQLQGELNSFIILNWGKNSDEELQLTQVDISQRSDLLPAIMKSPGPFHQLTNGDFLQDLGLSDEQLYLDYLNNVDIYEVTGKIDFKKITELCTTLLRGT